MHFIDTHTHLYLEEFKSDIDTVIEQASLNNIDKFFLPNIDSSAIEDMFLLEQKFPGKCYPMMGLHPCYVKENYQSELNIVEEWLAKRSFAAIGEIGLDYYWDTTFKEEQMHCFTTQMQWALKYDLPIVIHCRNATPETIEAVKPFAAKGLKGIFHCFGGSVAEANAIIDLGFLLGIGGVCTYKKAGLDEVLQHIDLQHIVLETDSPYLTPVPYRGKRNESAYIKIIAQRVAEIKACSLDEVAKVTTENALKTFKV
ncbi:MAG: TatD family hydrolase [Bacteroidota bacterium]